VPLHLDDDIPLSSKELSQWYKSEEEEYALSRRVKRPSEKASRDRHRWIMMQGMEVNTGASGRHGWWREEMRWPDTDESVDINLCVVVAIAGG